MCSDGTASSLCVMKFCVILKPPVSIFPPCFQCARYSQNDVVHQLQDTRNYLHLARGGVLLIHKMGPQSVNMFLSMQKIAVHAHSVRCWARCISTFSLSLSLSRYHIFTIPCCSGTV